MHRPTFDYQSDVLRIVQVPMQRNQSSRAALPAEDRRAHTFGYRMLLVILLRLQPGALGEAEEEHDITQEKERR